MIWRYCEDLVSCIMNFCGLRKTPSPLCVNKKNARAVAPQKVVTTQISSCGRRLRGPRWLGDWFVNFQCWKPRMLGADLVTQIYGEHPTNWRIDSMSCQIVSSTDNWKTSFKIEEKDVRVVGAPGHIFYDACRLLNIISKKRSKKRHVLSPQKRYFSSLSSRCAAFTLMQAFKSSLLFIWWQAENPGCFDWFFKDTPYIHLKPF